MASTFKPELRFKVLYAILVDGQLERIEGSSEFANDELQRRREQGHSAECLFATHTDEEFEQRIEGIGRSCLSGSLRTNRRGT